MFKLFSPSISDESKAMVDRELVSATVKNMKKRFGEKALAEVDIRIKELETLHHAEALELWVETRKFLCRETKSTEDDRNFKFGKGTQLVVPKYQSER